MQRYRCMSEAVAESSITDKVNLMLDFRERKFGLGIVEREER